MPFYRSACAGEGDPLTLVCTDVEGSTELWEWDNEAMMLVSYTRQPMAACSAALAKCLCMPHGPSSWLSNSQVTLQGCMLDGHD